MYELLNTSSTRRSNICRSSTSRSSTCRSSPCRSHPVLVRAAVVLSALLAAASFLALAASSPAAAKEIKDDTSRLLDQAQKLVAAGQADSALSVLRPPILRSAGDGRLERALVEAALSGGIPELGVAVIEESLRLRPGDLNLHVALGELELGRRRPEVAVRHFQRALIIDSASPAALGGFGRARARQGTDIAPAVSYLDKLAKLRPGTPEPRYGKGVLLAEAGRVEESLTEFRWAIGLQENNWIFERDYGRALLAQGNEKGGLEHLEKARSLVAESGDPVTAEQIAGEIRARQGGGTKG
jgi:Flp pilus assembly protein TadD